MYLQNLKLDLDFVSWVSAKIPIAGQWVGGFDFLHTNVDINYDLKCLNLAAYVGDCPENCLVEMLRPPIELHVRSAWLEFDNYDNIVIVILMIIRREY